MQGKLKSLKDVPNKTNTNIKQALFVGSSAELHKMLKNKNKDVQSEEDKNFEGKDSENNLNILTELGLYKLARRLYHFIRRL